MAKIMRGIGKVVKPVVNFPAWMGWRQIAGTGRDIKDLGKALLTKSTAKQSETFAEAMQRLHLSEQDIQQRAKLFFRMSCFYCAVAVALFIYVVYLLYTAHFAAAFLSLLLTVLSLALAFRQNFWYFQIKQRRLGCTVKEWLRFTFGGAK